MVLESRSVSTKKPPSIWGRREREVIRVLTGSDSWVEGEGDGWKCAFRGAESGCAIFIFCPL
jgi:hypothetical protein